MKIAPGSRLSVLLAGAALIGLISMSGCALTNRLDTMIHQMQGLNARFRRVDQKLDRLNETNAGISQLNGQMQSMNGEMHSMNEKMDAMNGELRQVRESMEAMQKEMREMRGTLDDRLPNFKLPGLGG